MSAFGKADNKSHNGYYAPQGGLPRQSQLITDRAVFTDSYAVMPKGVLRDIVTSFLPGWNNMRMWVLARPMTGFAETFSHYVVELQDAGGSDHPESDPNAQSVIFVVQGAMQITIDGDTYDMQQGGYAYLHAGCNWQMRNNSGAVCNFHWIRKRFQPSAHMQPPNAFVTNEADVESIPMPDCDGCWHTTRFVPIDDLRHDMHVNIVTLEPGAVIPFAETHVMEHGLYILQGKGMYLLNRDWVEVEAGDFLWLRAFCPQACYAGGPEQFKYLLYKDVNRHMPLNL